MSDVFWSPGRTLEEIEKAVILEAIRFFRNNKTQTALALGIAIRTLDYKLAKYRGETVVEEKPEEPKKGSRKNGDKITGSN